MHVVAQTNRGTRTLFLSGGCGGGGTKSLRLLPRLFLSLSLSLSFSSTTFFPHFPLRPSFSFAPSSPLFPFATAHGPSRSFFSSRATPLFMPPHNPGPSLSLSRAHFSFSLHSTHGSRRVISLVPFSPTFSSASLTPEHNHLRRFRQCSLLPSPLPSPVPFS